MDALKISEWLISFFKEEGIKINTVNRSNGYFIFEFGENSVTHFTIKRKNWTFGIWVTVPEENKTCISLFGEHNNYIDKFKPSRTAISSIMTFDDTDDYDDFFLNLRGEKEFKDFIYNLRCVQNHSNITCCDLYCDGSFKEFFHDKWYNNVTKKIDNFKINQLNYLFCLLLKVRHFFCFDKEVTFNIKDYREEFCSPKFEIQYRYYCDEDDLQEKYYKYKTKKSSIGFRHMIRVEHYYQDENRGFYYTED